MVSIDGKLMMSSVSSNFESILVEIHELMVVLVVEEQMRIVVVDLYQLAAMMIDQIVVSVDLC